MDFSYSEEQQAIRELAGQIIGDLATHQKLLELAREPDLDRELWAALAEANLLGLAIAEKHGGSGMGIQELCLLFEEQGRHVAPVPLLASLVLGALPVAEFGDDTLRERLLPGVATGELILSAGLNELGSSEPGRPRVTAVTEDDGEVWQLDGEKIGVPYAHVAHRVLVPALTGADSVGIFLVDPGAAGVELDAQDSTSHEPWFRMRLSGVRVASEDILGDPQNGSAIVDWLVERALVALSAIQLGVAEAALEQTAEYTATRKQFGKPIGSFQGVSLRAADGYIDVQAMRSTLWQAAWRLAEGLPADLEVRAARWWAAMGGHRVVHSAMHLHGGTGADIEYPIHRYFLWAKQNELSLGGAGEQLVRLGSLLAQDDRAEAQAGSR